MVILETLHTSVVVIDTALYDNNRLRVLYFGNHGPYYDTEGFLTDFVSNSASSGVNNRNGRYNSGTFRAWRSTKRLGIDTAKPFRFSYLCSSVRYGRDGLILASGAPAMYLSSSRRKTVWGTKRTVVAAALVILGFVPNAMAQSRHALAARRQEAAGPNTNVRHYRLDHELAYRANHHRASERTRAILTLQPGAQLPPEFERYAKNRLNIINGFAVNLPNGVLRRLAADPSVFRIHYDRPSAKFDYRTSLTIGAAAVNHALDFTGAGVGVAVVDSGIATWHDDLTSLSSTLYPYGNQRVSAFVDFVNGAPTPYDDNGHGTHVAGVIAGNGYDSNGKMAGIAPEASLVSLKVLGADGTGSISDVIAALDWV